MPSLKSEALEHPKEEAEWESPSLSSRLFIDDRRWHSERSKYHGHRYLPSGAWRTSGGTVSKTRPSAIERTNSTVRALFDELSQQWRAATMFESNVERIVLHQAYQRIIGLGPQVVPYIFQELEKAPDHWFWALTAIVGEDHGAQQTSISAAAEAWLAWGRNAGIIN